MVDFAKLLAANEIIQQLDKHGVPGSGTLSWSRVMLFVSAYSDQNNVIATIENDAKPFALSADQEKAWVKLNRWKDTDEPYFVLRGYAGAGKTYLLQLLVQNNKDILFTAPTNKAAKVLNKAVKCKTATTYSALGIRMVQNEDSLDLKFSDTPPEIPQNSILVVDECSMVGRLLYNFIVQTQERTECKVLFVGDPAQLPPVGEERSRTWKATEDKKCRAFLKQIMRYDNELLALATAIRDSIEEQDFRISVTNNNDGYQGVFKHDRERDFSQHLLQFKNPTDWQTRKVVAWRNKTVNEYNARIRETFKFTDPYHVGDVLLVSDPIEENGDIIASVDEEFIVTDVHSDSRRVEHLGQTFDIPVHRLSVTGDMDITLYVAKDDRDLSRILEAKAEIARSTNNSHARRAAWKDFWETKSLFHRVRYGYALTAHRAQGSTYADVYVDKRDILLNQNKREAFRCLYVAVTRASNSVHTY